MKTQLTLIGCALITSLTSASALANKPLEFKDVFDFKSAKGTQLSENGQILSLSATPYRGNATGSFAGLSNVRFTFALCIADAGSSAHQIVAICSATGPVAPWRG